MGVRPYDGPVVDAHFHLWDLARDTYPWLRPSGAFGPPGRLDALKGTNYRLENYRADVTNQRVVGSVHVEALWDPEDGQENETVWLDGLDKSDGLAIRYVAGAPFGHPRTAETIRRHVRSARVVGVRQTIAWTPDPDWRMVDRADLTEDAGWRSALPLLREHDLLLEVLMYPDQARNVADLARDHPWLTIVVNHMGSPIHADDAGVRAWRAGLATMAEQLNVAMKVSAATSYLPERTEAALEGYLASVLDPFTPDRVIVGSDFPVAGLDGWSYDRYMNAYRGSVRHLSHTDQEKVFLGNAMRYYRITSNELGPERR
jgi:predicted TIM-barrel fold metal-dependent hydrolase